MKPPCVVNFYLLSTEWSKNLFTIIIMDYKTADEKLPRNYALTIGLAMDTNMKASLCKETLENAAKAYPGIRGAIIH